MADRRKFGRSSSTESTEHSVNMGKCVKDKKIKKPKERWLLTRKTWRYMADAGRKLIPDGALNRPEDVPKIEEYFQEVCKREPRFLLWRKNSYPGAFCVKKSAKSRRKASLSKKALSVSEVDDLKTPPQESLSGNVSSSRYKIQQMKADFMKSTTPNISEENSPTGSETAQEKELINMLEQYLTISDTKQLSSIASGREQYAGFNYQDLINKLQQHLNSINCNFPSPSSTYQSIQDSVHFGGDYVQKSLYETLNRYFSHSSSRNKVISDLLTDRKTLEKLYFELRKTKGFRGSRGGTGYSPDTSFGRHLGLNSQHRVYKNDKNEISCPPPIIEVETGPPEIVYCNRGIQTYTINEDTIKKIEEEYKKTIQAERDERKDGKSYTRRRSSVDHDDVSQSVSDTIKRYLRMARKKSVDSDKADRFKRVNYDRNLRNIKAKGEITKPGDDDGLNKGCQTNDDWILTYRDLRFVDYHEVSDNESRFSSSRSSLDVGVDGFSPPVSPPPIKSASHSFLSHFLHHKHDKHDNKNDKLNAATAAMQKSKSSSNVIHQGGRLVAKTIFRSRSKSQTRSAQGTCTWTPQNDCVWSNSAGRQVVLNDIALLQLTEIERKVLQKVAIAKLQALNLGVQIKLPPDNVTPTTSKPKKRPYLLKKKALTTSIFDASRKDAEKDKDSTSSSGLVFGVPLTQCVENDKISRSSIGSDNMRLKGHCSGSEEPTTIIRHGSTSSFNSLIETGRGDESGSSESLLSRNRSVPGLLDIMGCESAADLQSRGNEDLSVPNILLECFRHIELYGLHTLGIFRVSTSKKRIRELRENFDCGKETTLGEDQCPHDVATLLKEYLRELPEPLLCRELYQAFIQTQRIRNRRLQFEALQHLIQLLPSINIYTLSALLNFLGNVARNSADTTSPTGEILSGNKMDSNNLATVIAPNILHCVKPGSAKEVTSDRPEDRIDVISVVRTLIDHYKSFFTIPAELLHEVYVYMMDSHPEPLEVLLNRREQTLAAEESVDELDSESYSATWSPTAKSSDVGIENLAPNIPLESDKSIPTEAKKMWSREEFLHEAAATGGPDMGMRIRHKDKIRERSRRKREASSSRKSKEEIEQSGTQPKADDCVYSKNRSSSMESSSSALTEPDVKTTQSERRVSSPYLSDQSGVITASLTIPVHKSNQGVSLVDDDIPYIEDAENSKQHITIGLVKSPNIPPRRRQRSISGSDSSVGSACAQPITASISLFQDPDSAFDSSTTYSSLLLNTPTSVSSGVAGTSTPPSWASTPPTSPDSNTSVHHPVEDCQTSPRSSMKKSSTSKEPSLLQKLTFTMSHVPQVQDVQPMKKIKDSSIINRREKRRSQGQSIYKSNSVVSLQDKPDSSSRTDQSLQTTITCIGNAVLRSRTADFEKMNKEESKSKPSTSSSREKKKYTKRRYTDSRHETKQLPSLEAINMSSTSGKNEDGPQTTPVYKRKELISSEHVKQN